MMRRDPPTTDNPGEAHASGSQSPPSQGQDGAEKPVRLPPRVPRQTNRPAQANVPPEKTDRNRLSECVRQLVRERSPVPPLDLEELRAYARDACGAADCGRAFEEYAMILVNNETWRDTVAGIPYQKRLLLLPQCLRSTEDCQAKIDELGLVCAQCGQCNIQHLQAEAEALGYAVLVAEGSAVVTKLIETGEIEAIVGVSCMDVLEKCFPHMEARAVPGIALPLLQSGCADTSIDLDWVREAIHLTSDDRTYRLDLDGLKQHMRALFAPASLAEVVGKVSDQTEQIAQDWLARDGKRWRPYLTACMYVSLQEEQKDDCGLEVDLKKLCVAVECFHKASLIHDDIEDDDDIRYGQKSLHAEHGMPVALNVGDFLLGEGYRLIGEVDGGICDCAKLAMLRTAAEGHLMLSRGQGAELCWARKPEPLAPLTVLDIFRKKTAPAFDVALRLGAHYAGAPAEVQRVLSDYSEALGIAYQIRDDLEDFAGLGDSDDLSDLRPSLVMAVAHKRAETPEERALTEAMWRRQCDYVQVADAFQRLISERHVIETVEDLLASYIEQATRTLQSLTNPTLKGLLRRVIGKIFGDQPIQGYCREFQARHAAGSGEGQGPSR